MDVTELAERGKGEGAGVEIVEERADMVPPFLNPTLSPSGERAEEYTIQ
jgi:hypothetical protein